VSALFLTDVEREHASVEAVFGLTGGELEDGPCPISGEGRTYRYWYEGVPEYATSDYRDDRRRLITVAVCELYGEAEAPDGWERLATFDTSGETSCPWCGEGTGNEDGRENCPLCEGDGLIYLGDGWREVVFAQQPVLHQPEDYFDGFGVRPPFEFDGRRYVLAFVSTQTTTYAYTHHFVIPEGETVDEAYFGEGDGLSWAQENAVISEALLQRLANHLNERLDLPYDTKVVLPDTVTSVTLT
jgi:hypothetical protein